MCDNTMASTKDDTTLYFKITGNDDKVTAGTIMTRNYIVGGHGLS